jgi:uncharacterized protein DUF3455
MTSGEEAIGGKKNLWLYSKTDGFDLTHPPGPTSPLIYPRLRLQTTKGLRIFFLATAVDASPIDVLDETLALYTENELDGLPIRACPLNNVSTPVNNSSVKLDGSSPGLSLKHVALGRGTQNYTCSNTNSTAVPTAIGEVATLFDYLALLHFALISS